MSEEISRLNDGQQLAEIQRLRAKVDELQHKETLLLERISLLNQQEVQKSNEFGQSEAIKRKEEELAEREHDLQLEKRRMESDFSDREFMLKEKERELQLIEDQLHMKSKDLKQKEFDIANADNPADISSSQMAELADREFELERREESLNYMEQRLKVWSDTLEKDDIEYKRRLKDLQQREAEFYVYSQTHTPHHDYAMDPTYGRHPHNETQPEQHHHHINKERTQHPDQTPVNQWSRQQPNYTDSAQQDILQRVRTDSREHHPLDHSIHVRANAGYYKEQQPGRIAPVGLLQESPSTPFTPKETQPGQIGTKTAGQAQHVLSVEDQLAKDLELARLIEEEEDKRLLNITSADEILALTLQREQLLGMEDGLTHTNELTGDHGGVASIMKELDERMTEEQRRKKQEEEDFLLAQSLANNPTENETATDTNVL